MVDQIRRHLAEKELSGVDLEERLAKADGWWEEVIAGDIALTLEDLFGCLETLGIEPADFSAEVYGLMKADPIQREALGRELAPGVYEEAVNRFFELVARRALRVEESNGPDLDGNSTH